MSVKQRRDRQAERDPRWAVPVLIKTLYPNLSRRQITALLANAGCVRLAGGETLADLLPLSPISGGARCGCGGPAPGLPRP